jgi:DNA-binding transcriptional ArsR family regulator
MCPVDVLATIAEPRRREILRLVWDRPRPVSEIAANLEITISAVSQHLSRLLEADLVTVEQRGRQRLYAAKRDSLTHFAPMLEAMWRSDLDQLAERVERGQRG